VIRFFFYKNSIPCILNVSMTSLEKKLQPITLLETPDVLVINKPAGLLVHPDGKHDEYSLVDWILKNYPDMGGVGESLAMQYKGEEIIVDRPGIVHRLDRETSGVLLLAKNQETYQDLKQQFQNHVIKKEYVAIVLGWPKDRGIINDPIGRSSRDIRIWSTGRSARGAMRDAITRYVVEKKIINEQGEKFAWVKLLPQTGRTHQLRVHMKSMQHPIIGDGLYAPKTLGMLGFDRVALHAHRISFIDRNGKEHTIEAPIPDEFKIPFLTK
jgi:23S rRNA pseudouridine1911/1915/1917 synthase